MGGTVSSICGPAERPLSRFAHVIRRALGYPTDINQRYQYQALHHQDSIRILELLPGAAGTALQCKLHEVRMSSQPSFEALSYTWGVPIFSKQLTETTSPSPAILSITENLFSALHTLRLPHSSRKLWVDSVCP